MKKTVFIAIATIVMLMATAATFVHYSQPSKHNPMRNLFKSDDPKFKKEWQKVDSLVSKGLPKSALEIVDVIYAKAKAKDIQPQYIKALIYKMKFADQVEEDSYVKILNLLEKEAEEAKAPVKNVLQSMIAEMYWRYYSNNRYLFAKRSETIDFKNDDIRTWDLKKLVKEVIHRHILALENPNLLKQTSIRNYEDILILEKTSPQYRPTLFDFLAHRAIDLFMNEEPNVTRPADKYEVNAKEYFSNAADFVKFSIASTDSISLRFYAAQLLQELEKFHQTTNNVDALVDVTLKRLQFAKANALFENRDSLYFNSLLELEKQYANHPACADVMFAVASMYYQFGKNYQPLESQDYKWELKKAIEKCDATAKKFSSTIGASNCNMLKRIITNVSIDLTAEEVVRPDAPSRALLTYKNTNKIYLQALKIDYYKFRRISRNYYNNNDMIKELKKLTPLKTWSQDVIDDGDYQSHAAEIKIPELPYGFYIIVVADEANYDENKGFVAYSTLWVSDIAYISRKINNDAYQLHVLNRNSSSPIPNVTVTAFVEKYNYSTRDYEFKKWNSFISNSEGAIEIPPVPEKGNEYSRSFYLEFSNGKDQYISESNFYQYRRGDQSKSKYPKTFFFTDRLIYRPGQTIYFKGLMLNTDGDKSELLTNYGTTVYFYDYNYQKVAEVALKTNEYGTFSGSFIAPTSGITGQMHIKNSYGSLYFSVEEYKRPKFEVTFEPVKGSYKLNEAITVKGIAKAYAGNAIDNAEVKFRVTRNARFPYWYWWWRRPMPSSPEVEIMNGNLTTDANGEFKVTFNAIPDAKILRKYAPVFTYAIQADITDLNGETRSSKTNVQVSYTALAINLDIPEKVNREDDDAFRFSTTNMSGQDEPAKGSITISRLQPPDRLYRNRLWERPDLFVMKKEEFAQFFPNDLYEDELNYETWRVVETKQQSTFETPNDKKIILKSLKQWQTGVYKIEVASKDAFGTPVKLVNYFTVFSENENKIPDNTFDWFTLLNYRAEPGETISFITGTQAQDVKVLYEVEHRGKIIHKEWLNLSQNQVKKDIAIKEEYRGNISFNLTFIKNGRSYQHTEIISVPYTNNMLDVEFITFRDKLQPGQKEEWKIKIKDKYNKGTMSEMLAAMYDASLDAFRPNYWSFGIYPTYGNTMNWNSSDGFGTNKLNLLAHRSYSYYITPRAYDQFNWFGFDYYGYYNRYSGGYYDDYDGDVVYTKKNGRGDSRKKSAMPPPSAAKTMDASGVMMEKEESKILADEMTTAEPNDVPLGGETGSEPIQVRTNFNETAFFYPHLQTDDSGNLVISFTIPESLTKWKMMGFAHTKDLKYGQTVKELVTQKTLMVQSFAPRFFRENDKMTFTSKVTNLAEHDLSGTAQLMLFDATTMQPIDHLTNNKNAIITFSAPKGQSTKLSWDIEIPNGIGAITYRVIAKAGNYSDGEEMAIPVLTNRMLVTESLPLPIRGNQSKQFVFEKLKNNNSSTLKHYRYTLEFTSNPAWYAIQALPYLMEYPYECSEQVFSRFYANSIASHIANSNPKIKVVFDTWKNYQPDALLSNLEKNQDLKALLLEETPWVLQAKNESERKQRIALLFDLNRMANELGRALKRLEKMQCSNGGWPWFDGMPDSRYITQHIVTGMGHLDHLGIKSIRDDRKAWNMLEKAVPYLDNRIREDYDWIKRHYPAYEKEKHLWYDHIQYLYARSYFLKDFSISKRNQEAVDYFKSQANKYWLDFNKYSQGMIALALHRWQQLGTPKDIMKSLKENAIFHDELGMYWKDMTGGYYWYQAPIETQALLIEAFDEVVNDTTAVEELKIWLLKQKQTQDWKTTKATVEACYALLLKGTDLLASDKLVEVAIGNNVIDPRKIPGFQVEAGTGYFKTSWKPEEITNSMGDIKVTKSDKGIAWGAVYWQYFEQLDKITPYETPLKLQKKLFVERITKAGPVIEPVENNTILKVGDKIKVRIELRVDRDMEYVHMKDMRASGFEPVNVISRYKYQDGLGYYESTRDAATNFFFGWLPKGTYVFEYPMFVTHKGDFSNGITTIQCMYAPEFTSHSEGVRVKVVE